jgi:hypothetical protein
LKRDTHALLAILLFAVGALLAPSPASAAEHLFLETFGSANEPSFGQPLGMALDPSSEELLVIDGEAETVSRWNPDGTPAEFSALGSNVIDGEGSGDGGAGGLIFGGAGEVQIAVDDSGTATDGNIYVTQLGTKVVDVFASSGAYLGQLTEYKEGPEADGTSLALNEPCGVAVDPSGNVYVGDFSGTVHKYEPSANPPVNADNSANFGAPGNCTLAAGAGATEGFIFATRYFTGAVAKLDSTTGEEEYEFAAAGSESTVSVNPANGRLFATRGEEIAEFDASGETEATEVTPPIQLESTAFGVAVNGANDDIYITRAGESHVEVFNAGSLLQPPAVTALDPSEGPIAGGNTVTITGTDLADVEEVVFGATPAELASLVEVSPTEIEIEAPAHAAGTVDVIVTTAGGESINTAADDYTYVEAPTVSAIAPSEGPTAGGTTVTITGTDLANVEAVEFGNVAAKLAGLVEVSPTEIEIDAPGHAAGTFDVIVTTPGGASPDTPADDYTYVAPPAVFALSPAQGPTAGGNQVEITGARLAEATKVEFGSAEVACPSADCALESATEIKVNAPAHAAGKVNVRVTTLGGASGNFPADDYTYVVPTPAPLPAPETGGGSGGSSGSPAPAPLRCTVPKLKGLRPARARAALSAAHCKAGDVSRPKGKHPGPLVVRSSKPGAGAILPAGGEVDLRLGPKQRKVK